MPHSNAAPFAIASYSASPDADAIAPRELHDLMVFPRASYSSTRGLTGPLIGLLAFRVVRVSPCSSFHAQLLAPVYVAETAVRCVATSQAQLKLSRARWQG
eukprot:1954881-Pyramimonas_sp.AAC.1